MISSTTNGKIKQVIALMKKNKTRKELGLFVIEGLKMYQELPKDRVVMVYISESFLTQINQKEFLKGVPYEIVTDEVMKTMSDTQTPQGILALVKQYNYTLQDLLMSTAPLQLIILETIQDPGNLGTILRAGEGAGITGVLMDSTTADIYNPKVIRSTMGSIYRVPFVYTDNLRQSLEFLKKNGILLCAAHLNGRNNYDQEDYTDHIGFLIGNEAGGLSDDTAALADIRVKIPMSGQVESLNAAVAASILMFEAARQRRNQMYIKL